jgi:hypothetical protein
VPERRYSEPFASSRGSKTGILARKEGIPALLALHEEQRGAVKYHRIASPDLWNSELLNRGQAGEDLRKLPCILNGSENRDKGILF